MKEKFKIQDDQYAFPYHHLVTFRDFDTHKVMMWGFEYYAYISKVISLVKGRSFSSLLDVGCGEGKMILELSREVPGGKLKGVDLSERAILFARAFNFGNTAEFSCEDVSTMSERYDIITLVETLEHIPDDEVPGFVQAVAARLNEGGILVVSVPAVNFPVLTKHYRHYDLSLLSAHLEGFQLEEVHYLVKQGLLYTMLVRLFGKCSSFRAIRFVLFSVAKRFVFEASPDTARHLVGAFKKI